MTPSYGHTGTPEGEGPTSRLYQKYARLLVKLSRQRATTNRFLGAYERAVEAANTKLTGQKRELDASQKDLVRATNAVLLCLYEIEDAIEAGVG